MSTTADGPASAELSSRVITSAESLLSEAFYDGEQRKTIN